MKRRKARRGQRSMVIGDQAEFEREVGELRVELDVPFQVDSAEFQSSVAAEMIDGRVVPLDGPPPGGELGPQKQDAPPMDTEPERTRLIRLCREDRLAEQDAQAESPLEKFLRVWR